MILLYVIKVKYDRIIFDMKQVWSITINNLGVIDSSARSIAVDILSSPWERLNKLH